MESLDQEKTNLLFNLISQEPYIDKIYLYAKDPFEAKYQFLINKQESAGSKHFNDSKTFVEYSNNMDNIYKNRATELLIRRRKLNIYHVFLSHNLISLFQVLH